MKYEIQFTPLALRNFEALPKEMVKRVDAKIQMLAENPRPVGVQKLKGGKDLYRIRVGDYRIVYEIIDTLVLITVVNIGHRKEIYR